MSYLASPRGFTLLETVVATGILVTALAGLAQLFVLGTHLTRDANVAGAALIAAQDALERLASLSFRYDATGATITDSLLQPSPASSLDRATPPYVDWLGLGGAARTSPSEAIFERRWRIVSLYADAPETLAIEVCVFRMPAENATARSADACLSTVQTRQP